MAEKTKKPKKSKKTSLRVDQFDDMDVAKAQSDAYKSFKHHEKVAKNRAKNKKSPTGRAIDDVLRGIIPGSMPKSTEMEPEYADLWGRSTPEKVKRIRDRNKKKASKKRGGGIVGRGMGVALRGGGAVTRG